MYEHRDKEFGEFVGKTMTEVSNRYLKGITEMGVDFETLHSWTK